MKILYLSLSPVPSRAANSVQVVKTCAAMVRAGHDVRLFHASTPETRSVAEDTTIQRWYGITEMFETVSHDLSGIRFLGRWIYGRKAARSAAEFRRDCDLIYGRDIYALRAAQGLGIPIVYEAHMPPPNRMKRAMHRRLFQAAHFRRLVVVSNRLAEYYRRTFPVLGSKEVVVAPNGADLPLEASEPAQSSRSVGYIGQLHPHKGPALVVELARALPDVDFHIVGGRPDDIAHWRDGAPENLEFHGHVDQTILTEFYRSFKVVLAPYRRAQHVPALQDDTEWGSPLKLFEYMANGCCIVASDLPVIRELVDETDAAVLCPPHDVPAWLEAVRTLLNDPEQRARHSLAARNRFLENYTRDVRINRILAGLDATARADR